jgi:hypothetical protein
MSHATHNVPHTWKNAPYTDWTVIIDDKSYPLHRYFLGCGLHSSSYFNSQFRAQDSNLLKTDLSGIPESCKKRVWEKVLDFIYLCDCKPFTVEPNDIVPLLCISDYLQIPALTQFINKRFEQEVQIPTNSLIFFKHSIDLNQEKSLKISQQQVTKNFSTFPPDSFTKIPFDNFKELLSKVSEHIVVEKDPKVADRLGISIVKSIICFIDNDNISKEQFEKLTEFVKGGEKEDILKLLIKSHNLGSERHQDFLFKILMKDFEQLDNSILSKLPTKLFISLIVKAPKSSTQIQLHCEICFRK